ncbi:hypothetical protein BpHYR1_015066 [Brachionus plicatilis]|uniref:Uncharacterized protein n=1 Tax=Brachionus plicatilis TaxID=10195 RepID=A0A3M7SNQ6_BRAPC|nr:hypothetical protein BpHYR1_015066 [Brachionus plicatilis]
MFNRNCVRNSRGHMKNRAFMLQKIINYKLKMFDSDIESKFSHSSMCAAFDFMSNLIKHAYRLPRQLDSGKHCFMS